MPPPGQLHSGSERINVILFPAVVGFLIFLAGACACVIIGGVL